MNKKYFKTTNELQNLTDKYFNSLEPDYRYDKNGEILLDKSGIPIMTEREPATVSALAYSIGCTSRNELMQLRNIKKYSQTVNRALLRLEAYTEKMLFDKSAAAGAKYILQTDFGRESISQDSENGIVVLASIESDGDK